MSWESFLAARAAYHKAATAYVAHLPLWVNVWRGWEYVIFLSSIFFLIWKVEARWLLATMILSVSAYDLLGIFLGVSRFQSIALVVCWGPLAFYIYRRLRARLAPGTGEPTRSSALYTLWLGLVLATLLVSIAFDLYNVAHYFAVDARHPAAPPKAVSLSAR